MLITKKLLTKILTNLKSPIIAYTHTIPSRSYAANSATWFIDVPGAALTPPQGYTAIGVLGASASSSGQLIINPIITSPQSNHIHGFVWNKYTSAITQTIVVSILCIRTDLL